MDALFATGLATALDPSRGPERVVSLLLRACEEVAARTTTRTNAQTDAVELVIEAPRGALPREAMRRVLDAAPVDALGDFQKNDTRDGDAAKSAAEKAGETDGPRGSEPRVSLRLRRTRYRLRAPRDSDDEDDENDGDDTVTEDAVEKSLPEVTEVTEVDVSTRRSRAEARRALAAAAAKALDVEVPDENDLVVALATVVGGFGGSGSGSGGRDPCGQSVYAFSAASGWRRRARARDVPSRDFVSRVRANRRGFIRAGVVRRSRSRHRGARRPVPDAAFDTRVFSWVPWVFERPERLGRIAEGLGRIAEG